MSNQKPQVCVLTGRSMAAIGSVAIAGTGAEEVLGKIFLPGTATAKHPSSHKLQRIDSLTVPPTCRLEAGGTLHGSIVDGERVVDEVVVGCEGPELFVIHCHGNPLLLEQVVKLARTHGAVLTDADAFMLAHYRAASDTLLEAEAKLAMQTCATLTGVKILAAQIDSGLSLWAKEKLDNIDTIDAEQLKKECKDILRRSRIASFFTQTTRIVIAGPPNAGKSTLLNAIAGQREAIVSHIEGTTRDWISVTCDLKNATRTDKIHKSIRVEFIDTAGLNVVLAGTTNIDSQAQQITHDLLTSCDLILYVLDVTKQDSLPESLINIDAQPVITVYNKCDLGEQYSNKKTHGHKEGDLSVSISAENAVGIDSLVETIFNALDTIDIHPNEPVIFTERQRVLLERLCEGQPPQSCLSQILD